MSDELRTTDTTTRWRGLLATAQQVGHYSWTERRLFEILGGWSVTESDPALKVQLDAQSHRHAWHAALLFDRLPELREVDAEALIVAPSPAFATVLDDLDATGRTVDRLVGLHRVVLPPLLAAYRDEVDARTDVADGSLRRWLGLVIADLDADRLAGEQMLRDMLDEPGADAPSADHAAALERAWSLAGGLRA